MAAGMVDFCERAPEDSICHKFRICLFRIGRHSGCELQVLDIIEMAFDRCKFVLLQDAPGQFFEGYWYDEIFKCAHISVDSSWILSDPIRSNPMITGSQLVICDPITVSHSVNKHMIVCDTV